MMENSCDLKNEEKKICLPVGLNTSNQCPKCEQAKSISPCENICLTEKFFQALPGVAWPITTLILLVFFKKQINELFEKLIFLVGDTDNFTYKDLKWTRRQLRNVISQASDEHVFPEITGEYEIDEQFDFIKYKHLSKSHSFERNLHIEKIYSLLKTHPRAAIMEAWIELEMLTKEFVNKKDLSKQHRSIEAFKSLLDQKVITQKQFKLISQLRTIRNKIAHSTEDFPVDEAAGFVNTTLKLCYFLIKKLESNTL